MRRSSASSSPSPARNIRSPSSPRRASSARSWRSCARRRRETQPAPSPSPWPDEPVYSAQDVINHLLRRNYGTLNLGAVDGVIGTSALEVLGRFLERVHLHALLAVVGAVVALRRRDRGVTLVMFTALVAL